MSVAPALASPIVTPAKGFDWRFIRRGLAPDSSGNCCHCKAGSTDLERRAVAVSAALVGRAEQVAVGVGDQAGQGVSPSEPLKLTSVVGALA